MYKSRIQAWGLDKKLKEQEARAIICMLAQYRGKASYTRLRGRRVEIKAAESHLARKGIAIGDVLSTGATRVPNLIICEMPETSERGVPRCPASPDPFKTTELLCVDVREYILSSFGTGLWLPQRPDQYCSIEGRLQNLRSVEIYFEVIAIFRYHVMDQPGTAMKEIRTASTKIVEFIECQTAENLLLTIRLIAMMLFFRRAKGRMLSKQLCSISATHDFGDSHVNMYMQRIFTRISQLAFSTETPDYLLAATRSAMDSHAHVLGQYHPQTLHIVVILSQMMCRLYGPDGLSEPLKALLSSLESQQGPGTRQSMMLWGELRRLKKREAESERITSTGSGRCTEL